MLRLKLGGCPIAKRLLNSLSIVKSLDLAKDAEPCVLEIVERLEVRPFVLQRPEESLHGRVVVAARCGSSNS